MNASTIYIKERKRFNEYLGEFEQLLLEAGESTWEDVIKCGFLTNGLNIEMRQPIESLQAAKNFVEYYHQLSCPPGTERRGHNGLGASRRGTQLLTASSELLNAFTLEGGRFDG